MKQRAFVFALGAAALVVAGAVAWWWAVPRPPLEDRLRLRVTAFTALGGWADDDHGAALAALLKSCARLAGRADGAAVGAGAIGGRVADWRPACRAGAEVPAGARAAARRFFEAHFTPLDAANNREPEGLFTGYFEPELRGSRRAQGRYRVPLYARPEDLVSVDLGAFRAALRGQRLAGRVVAGRLRPFSSRADIDSGALAGRGLELVWVDSAIDAFFLHIQGSGRVVMDDGAILRLGYAAQNGHPYFAIGRELIARGALTPETTSLQSIRAWLEANPDEAAKVMAKNPSFIFFRTLDGEGPVGAQGVVLSAGRSLAVDRRYLPLGAPVWLDTVAPAADPGAPEAPLRRLFVAQDTGGAIRGPVRGDVYWGSGAAAGAVAGRMRSRGQYYLLLPKSVVARGDPWAPPDGAAR